MLPISVLLLVIAIAIHHFLFDRDPRKVPDYVKNSIQFSSESEGSDTEQERGDDDDDANSQDDNNGMVQSVIITHLSHDHSTFLLA